MTRPDPRLARTRGRVLEGAYALLVERGFGNVTMDEVSLRSGVAKSTLYRHWTTRDDLLRDAFSERALARASVDSGLADALVSYALTFADGLGQTWGRAAASLAVAALDDPEQRRAQQVFVVGYTADLTGLVHTAVANGEIPPNDDIDEILDRLVAALFYRYLFVEGPLDRRFVEREVGHALNQLRRTPPPSTHSSLAIGDHREEAER